MKKTSKSTIISSLRTLWLKSNERYIKLKNARKKPAKYECNECKQLFILKEVQVHHVIPVAEMEVWDWNVYIDRLFNGEQVVLCKQCHKNIHKK